MIPNNNKKSIGLIPPEAIKAFSSFVKEYLEDNIVMKKSEMKEEHDRLLDVLKNPTNQKLKEEYDKQKSEMESYDIDSDDNDIIPIPEFRTFDFHEMEGKAQTAAENKKIHNQIINHPEEPMTDGGESFYDAADRALPIVGELLETDEPIAIITHNSMYGLIKLWYESGRPEDLDKEFRIKYTKQDNENPTGSYICMSSDNDSEVYLIRHGETDDNNKKVFRTRHAMLTSEGKQEASDIGDDLKDEGITKIYSSDLPRAMETAEIILNTIRNV